MPDAVFDLTASQVTEFIQSLTHEARWRMFSQLNDQIEWNNFDRLTLEDVNIEQAEEGKKPGFLCPHCDEAFETSRLKVVDVATTELNPRRVNHDTQVVYVYNAENPDDIVWEHCVLLCPECSEPVGLPYRWDHDHD